ncbi:hypothetical protein BDV96DRAFT_649877 [Lophiotrema nucula]|uniref:Uncharacterized protein n=1 Tax=Lophiotrema nucula TaxID=690887 RepID=A0A6A5YXK0_9PLEO|nr:hypothetical protein BDV96DRAFT_649877 [Lophiotrema nucula]
MTEQLPDKSAINPPNTAGSPQGPNEWIYETVETLLRNTYSSFKERKERIDALITTENLETTNRVKALKALLPEEVYVDEDAHLQAVLASVIQIEEQASAERTKRLQEELDKSFDVDYKIPKVLVEFVDKLGIRERKGVDALLRDSFKVTPRTLFALDYGMTKI